LYLVNGFSQVERLNFAYESALLILGEEVEPIKIKKIEEGLNENVFIFNLTSSFKVETVEKLNKEFSKTQMYNKPRIFIIENIDLVSEAVLNKLLVFLEEPISKESYGFLLTSNKEAVLATILSRAQIISLNNYDLYEFSKELIEINGYPPIDAKIASIGNRSLGEVNLFIGSTVFEELKNMFTTFVDTLFDNRSLISNVSLRNLYTDKSNLIYFVDILLIFYVDLLYYKMGLKVYFEELLVEIKKISMRHDIKRINEYIKIILSKKQVLNYMVNYDLQINDLLLDLGE
jgi:DNA polymerase-3 subunit delta'